MNESMPQPVNPKSGDGRPKTEYTTNSYGRRELEKIDGLRVNDQLDRFAEDLIKYAKNPEKNSPENKEYLERQLGWAVEGIAEETKDMELLVATNEIKAGLYIGFRDESERQKTKMGGFKGYVQRFIDDMRSKRTEPETEIDRKLEEYLLLDTVRSNVGEHTAGEGDWYEGRVNYKKEAEKLKINLKELEERKLVLKKIFQLAISEVPERK